jgi:aminopeptidase N
MENVSSTTLGENSLADARSGFRPMASLNSHELAHQWFGDLVTCRDWGQAWLNEGWATFGEKLYMEYSRGHWQYDRDIDDDMGAYFGEARRYQRPVATNVYTSPDDMFDSHAYPKGGAILHTFRRLLGDEAFFKGVQLYLTRNRHSPVESVDLERALTEASGINMKPAFDQWVYKPGHPVLDYGYTYDETKRALTVTVKQTQNTENGTPVYDIPAKIGVIVNGKVERFPFRLNVKEQTATFTLFGKPDAVLLDPDHDFLREIPKLPYLTKAANENDSELIAIARYAPNATDRARAFARMLTGSPSERVIAAAVEVVQADTDNFPAIVDLGPLVRLRREALRPVFRSQLTQVNVERQAWGVSGLAALPANDEDRKRVEGFINDKAPYTLVVASVNALGAWKSADSVPLLQKALAMPSRREVVRQAALEALARVSPQEGERAIVQAFEPNKPQNLRQAALSAAGNLPPSPQTQALFRSALKDKAWLVVLSAATAVANQGDKTLLPDVQAAQNNLPPTAPRWVAGAISSAATRLEKGQTVPSGESGGEGN